MVGLPFSLIVEQCITKKITQDITNADKGDGVSWGSKVEL